MELKRMGTVLAAALGILCGLGTLLITYSRPLSQEENQAVEKARTERDFSLSPAEVSHGKDHAIFWQDAGMEAHIRFLLDRPEGVIYESDVWDIRCLAIYDYRSAPIDIMVKGEDTLTRQSTLEDPSLWRYWESREFPPINNLKDLRYFDSLQIFCLFQKDKIAYSDIEKCDTLQIVEIDTGAGRGNGHVQNEGCLRYDRAAGEDCAILCGSGTGAAHGGAGPSL